MQSYDPKCYCILFLSTMFQFWSSLVKKKTNILILANVLRLSQKISKMLKSLEYKYNLVAKEI